MEEHWENFRGAAIYICVNPPTALLQSESFIPEQRLFQAINHQATGAKVCWDWKLIECKCYSAAPWSEMWQTDGTTSYWTGKPKLTFWHSSFIWRVLMQSLNFVMMNSDRQFVLVGINFVNFEMTLNCDADFVVKSWRHKRHVSGCCVSSPGAEREDLEEHQTHFPFQCLSK